MWQGNSFAGLLGGQGLGQRGQMAQDHATHQANQQGLMNAQIANQQSGLLNQQTMNQDALNEWWARTPPCKHEIVDSACKHCSESTPSLVAKALRRKKHEVG